MPVTREQMAAVLEEIALLLEIQGENPFKVRAYRQGAEVVESYDGDIVALAVENKLDGIKGLGEALRDKLHELASTGELGFHKKLRESYPDSFFTLFQLDGLGPKKIAALHKTLGVDSIPSLKAACEAGSVAGLSGFGAKTQTKILEAIGRIEQAATAFRLDVATLAAEEILEELRKHPDVLRVSSAGSLRRSKEVVGDLDFIVATNDPAALTKFFGALPQAKEIIVQGDTKCSIRLEDGLQCDLRAVTNAQFPFALQYFTGSKEHNVAIRSRALKHGWSLNEYGFTGNDLPTVNEEGDIYKALGLDFIPPALRENRGEIEAADEGKLPRLVEWENLRGTFHCHTTDSDGKNTLNAMAEAAQELGLQYLGISDHSKSSPQANGLNEVRLAKQIDAVAAWNKEFGSAQFRLFAGSEVDILKDGSLDFSDEMLSSLDWAVASVHNATSLDEDEMTKRIIRAMENPYVTMLGHMTGRLLLRRDAYRVNHEKLIDAAAETRTVIELNCNPKRFDMDWRWWHRARDKGVLCSINPDAHSTGQLQYIRFGADVARKGWLRREDVLNTKPLAEMAEWLKLPKAKR
ncbi:DNA polymerase/3'-5' exonuclease PolX [Luteolibacter luteus]|uniref:DNA polymerase/3'-5' exonuclease PolX n=1 Tax=Luteolibacter luteus TaxID=2728835 RepID=A0A858RDP8_9BACT|nr:DNA polymerase/3'-5' exonuclease PolX [Luteolibacter luteus]QJE94751.1 DNA polymerase/3'-5' exonuclease PolX [Luteolibacter luteus]